jgi:hypothetical protein
MRPLDCAKKQWKILANRLYIVCSNADQSPRERRIISESLYNRRMIEVGTIVCFRARLRIGKFLLLQYPDHNEPAGGCPL